MNDEIVIAVFVSASLTALLAYIAARLTASKQAVESRQLEARIRELERELHEKEREFLVERNRIELTCSENSRRAREVGFQEGREIGASERTAAHIIELSDQRAALLAKFEVDRASAVAETTDKIRSEYELQAKLFSVKIVPYVSIAEVKGLFRNHYQTVTGYQYQLLVNGIPAFSPHVVAEHTEIRKEINPEVERALINTAERAANGAIDLYLGGSRQFAKIAAPVLKRVPTR